MAMLVLCMSVVPKLGHKVVQGSLFGVPGGPGHSKEYLLILYLNLLENVSGTNVFRSDCVE